MELNTPSVYEKYDREEILKELGEKFCPGISEVAKYDDKQIEDEYQKYVDHNHEQLERMQYVDKPEFLIKKHANEEQRRQGWKMEKIIKPLKNEVIIKMNQDEIIKNNIKIHYNQKQKDRSIGTIISGNTDFINKKVIFNLKMVRDRININNCIHVILHRKDILAVYE